MNSARMAVVTRWREIMVFYNTHNYLGGTAEVFSSYGDGKAFFILRS